MKKIYRYFFAAVAIASAAACAEQLDDNQAPVGQAPAGFAQMTISASLGEVTKTTYDNQNVLWEGTESITVFSKGSESSPAQFDMDWCSEDKAKASFTGLADLNAESYYAVYPHSATNACTSEGVLTVNIPAEQTAVAGGFASGANVSVAAWQNAEMSSENDIIFNNVCSLLSFGFETDADAILTKSVTIKVKKNATAYYGIAGNVSVNYEADGDLVVSEGSAQSIVLNAPEGGFAKGETYYVAVAPVGTIAEMELLYTHTDGTTTCERKNSNIVASLTRSTLVPLETIPVAYDDLPQEDFEVVLDFAEGWMLSPDCLLADQQLHDVNDDTNRDKYTYSLVYESSVDGSDKTKQLQVMLFKGGISKPLGYECVSGKGLIFKASSNTNVSGVFHLPIIDGRYIDHIDVTYLLPKGYTTTADLIRNYIGTSNKKSIGKVDPAVTEDTEKSYVFDLGSYASTLALPTECRIGSRSANFYFKKISVTYSKNIPTK